MFGNYEFLSGATIRIEILDRENNVKSTGTGFIFIFSFDGLKEIPCIITNKHVVLDLENKLEEKGKFFLHLANDDGTIDYKESVGFIFNNFGKSFIFHPDPDVDLCAFPLAFCQTLYKGEQKIYIPNINELMVYSGEELENLGTVEDVIMIGYPNGLWDDVNNLPIVRKGSTATHPKLNYRGKKEFVIDMPCYPGSSGSPVFVVDEGFYVENGKTVTGNRIILLGILYSGPVSRELGEIVDLPYTLYAKYETTVNLGYAIHGNELLRLKELIRTHDVYRVTGNTKHIKVGQ